MSLTAGAFCFYGTTRQVAVVALRQLARVQRAVRVRRSVGKSVASSLRRWTRRYSSQRDEFYHWWQLSRCDNSARVQRAVRVRRSMGKSLASSLRRWTRRYSSQRDEFHLW